MKYIFLFLVIIHALIHLLGFVKAFNLRPIDTFTVPVSRTAGLFWLAAALLLLAFAVLWLLQHSLALPAGLVAMLLSQILIFTCWKDARFGTIANVIIGLGLFMALGQHLIFHSFKKAVSVHFTVKQNAPVQLLTEEDLALLPQPVRAYIRYTGAVGKPKIQNFRATFTGGMRGKPNDSYMPMQSVQYNFLQAPSRYFYMTAKKAGLPATGLHVYENATATFTVKMLNWIRVVDAAGPQLNQAETVTVLNDMCFIAPGSLIDNRIRWETINDATVKAVFTNQGITVSAMLYFNKEGQLINFISNDRYETDGKTYQNFPWATPVTGYRNINGYMLPGSAKLIYQKPEGDFTYGALDFGEVEYNVGDWRDG